MYQNAWLNIRRFFIKQNLQTSMSTSLPIIKLLGVLCALFFLNGCGFFAGMENINTYAMKRATTVEKVQAHPTFIPISPALISDQHVNTYHYRVAVADVLFITVWDHPEFLMSGTTNTHTAFTQNSSGGQTGYLVNANGEIYYPLIGYVHVANKTTDMIRADIADRLDRYVPNPQVNVGVSEFRGQKIYVLGAVEKVGFIPITDQRLTLADALATSGWIKQGSANPRGIYVIRGNYSRPKIFWLNAATPDKLLLAEHFSMQPQDILYVSTAPVARLAEVFNQILPFIQAIWFTQAVVKNA